jgi:transposase
MIIMKTFQRIKQLKKMGYRIKEIAKKLELDRKTVRKYANMSEERYKELVNKYRNRGKSFEPYKEDIVEIFKRNSGKYVCMSSVYDMLEEKHGALPGGSRTLRNYVAYLKENGDIETKQGREYRPVPEPRPGSQIQIDFGQIATNIGKMFIFVAVLAYSRRKYITCQDKPFRAIDVIRHMIDCFEYHEGIAVEVVIDQDATMVVDENEGDILLTREFRQFREEMGFTLRVCRKADPESKGKVENSVKHVKTGFFSGRVFDDIDELKSKLTGWIRRINTRISQATMKIPETMWEEEKLFMKPLRRSIFGENRPCDRERRKVDAKSLISVRGSFYSVPAKYRNKEVEIVEVGTLVLAYEPGGEKEIARHEKSPLKGRKVVNKSHYRDGNEKKHEVHGKLISLSDCKAWKRFVEMNMKAYGRYFREQSDRLFDLWGRETDNRIVEQALVWCCENELVSAKNLEEAISMLSADSQPVKEAVAVVEAKRRLTRGAESDVEVAKRSVSFYSSLIGLLGGRA